MELLGGIVLGVIILTLLVVLHELGHGLVAKKHGVVVEEFGVGFPPKAWSKKVDSSILGKNVVYSINWLPLGGFVKLQGEHDSAHKKGDYGAVSFWKKTQILLAGVAVNWLTAAALLTVLAATGMPHIISNQFYIASDAQISKQPVKLAEVTKDMPAEQSGLRAGDTIVRFAGVPLASAADLAKVTGEHKGEKVEVIYSRDSVEQVTTVAVRANNDDKKGYIGAKPTQLELIRSTWSAPLVGVGLTTQLSWLTIQGLGDMLANIGHGLVMKLSPSSSDQVAANAKLAAVGDNVAGPIGIFAVIFPAAEKAGMVHVVMLAAIISLTLAVMNILPIPALDGGRWFVTALFKLLKKPLTKDTEEKIHSTGFMFLMALIVLVTIADIGKLR
ncbi:MAG: M50 family metallopeptidase [Candidatus Saccharimonas sp.]